MNTGIFRTKMSDNSLFRVDRIVTTTSKTGYVVNTAWGQYIGAEERICPLDCTRINFNEPKSELEVKEYLLDRRIKAFEYTLEKQMRLLGAS